MLREDIKKELIEWETNIKQLFTEISLASENDISTFETLYTISHEFLSDFSHFLMETDLEEKRLLELDSALDVMERDIDYNSYISNKNLIPFTLSILILNDLKNA